MLHSVHVGHVHPRLTRDVLAHLGRHYPLLVATIRPVNRDRDEVRACSDLPFTGDMVVGLRRKLHEAELLARLPRKQVVHLGLITGAVMRAHRQHTELHDDVDAMHAPSECHGLIKPIDWAKVLEPWGITEDEYHALVEYRCGPKVAHDLRCA